MSFLSRLSLQKRFMLYVTIWLVVIALIYTYISFQAIEQSTDMILQERLALAQNLADQMDNWLGHTVAELEDVGGDLAPAVESSDRQTIDQMLDQLYRHWADYHQLRQPFTLTLIDPEGLTLWSEPDDLGHVVAPDFRALVDPQTSRITQYPLEGAVNKLTVSIAVPVRDERHIVAYLMGEFDLNYGNLGLTSPLATPGSSYNVELVDQNGQILLSAVAGRQGNLSVHAPLFTQQLQTQRSTAQIHELPENEGRPQHIVAYAPLEQVPWGVFVEQEEKIAFRLPRLLRTQLVVFGLLVLTAGLATAWLATYRAVGPVTHLIAATRRIASGDLDQPISIQRQDEIGQLAAAFERMRQDLAAERGRTQELAILEERDRLAREMHDGFAQALSVLNLNAKAIRQALTDGNAAQTSQVLDELDQIIDQTYADVREAISSLRVATPHKQGLIAIVDQYLEEFGLQYDLETQLDVVGAEHIYFSTSQEIQLLRIIQEALSNVRKHAEASRVQVSFAGLNGQVEITIVDNGRGFETTAVERPPQQAFGLVIMRERAESLNGTFRLESQPGAGATVVVRVPLESGNEHHATHAHFTGR